MATRTEDLPPVQRLSKRLFGTAYRLEIAVLIYELGAVPINPTDLTKRLRETSEASPAHSCVAAELEKLESCGLLMPLKSTVRDTYFERVGSVFWDFCLGLRDEVQGEGHAKSSQGSR